MGAKHWVLESRRTEQSPPGGLKWKGLPSVKWLQNYWEGQRHRLEVELSQSHTAELGHQGSCGLLGNHEVTSSGTTCSMVIRDLLPPARSAGTCCDPH